MATHSGILVWRIPWTEKPDRLQSTGSQESDTTQRLNHHHQWEVTANADDENILKLTVVKVSELSEHYITKHY